MFGSHSKAVWIGALVGLCVGGGSSLLNIVVHWASVYGPQFWAIPGVEFFVLPAIFAVLVLPIGCLACVFERSRALGIGALTAALVTILLLALGLDVGWRIRESGFSQLARSAGPLVDAIKLYEATYGSPPASLEALPPGTAKGLPRFDYFVGSSARETFDGNPWVLSLDAGTGFLNWDQFLYYPLQNYPKAGHGGWIKPIGDWAYVNE